MDKYEIYEKAENIIKQRRDNAIARNDRRIEEINKIIPEIREENEKLFNTGFEIIDIVSRGGNVEYKMAELKKKNWQSQMFIKDTLKHYGYSGDYLDMKYYCKNCNDTGYNEKGEYCECFMELIKKISSEEFNKDSHINLSEFETFRLSYYEKEDYDIMSRIFERCKKFAYEFGTHNDNILMTGDTGLGKTHLSLAIANEVIKKGYNVIYDSAMNIFHKIENEHFGRDRVNDTISLVNDVDLLIIDDLGTEFESSFYNSTIYNIINTRINMLKSTIISTNLDRKEIEQRYSKRIYSRLTTMYTCFTFRGKDIRNRKKLESFNNQ
ncbi:MAG: ATP-binding protein [Oscillospiraceae bacterium]|nr:ATP-binding protein [Oscillospiraceae bacterium]